MNTNVMPALRRAAVHAALALTIAMTLLYLPRLPVLTGWLIATAIFIIIDVVRLKVSWQQHFFLTLFSQVLRREEVHKLTGATYLLLGCYVTGLIFPPAFAAAALVFLGLGDAAAAVVCAWQGSVNLWHKNWAGNVACLGTCLVAATLMSFVWHLQPLAVVFSGAVVAAVVQALPVRWNDNITIPLSAALVMWLVSLI